MISIIITSIITGGAVSVVALLCRVNREVDRDWLQFQAEERKEARKERQRLLGE